MNELKIVINQELGTISTNFEEVKTALTDQMEIYKKLEVTEENKAERKKDIATLRKMIKSVTEKKSTVKAECLKPYSEFETKANELIGIIENPIKTIDYQVKTFEEEQLKKKKSDIAELYDSLIGDLADDVSLDSIYGDKWTNVATTLTAIKKEMTDKIQEINQSIGTIKAMASDKTEDALDSYFNDFNLSKAIKVITDYEQQKREIQARLEEQQRLDREREIERERIDRERQLEAEKEKVRAEERAKIREEQRILEEQERIREEERIATEQRLMAIKEPEEVVEDLEAPFVADDAPFEVVDEENAVYRLSATKSELNQVEMYMNSIGVEWERVND